jgi:hypothetical protein
VDDQFRVSRSSDSRDHLLDNRRRRLLRVVDRHSHSHNRNRNRLVHHRNKVVVENQQVVRQRIKAAEKERSRNDLRI